MHKILWSGLLIASLAACGGGGGAAPTPVAPTPVTPAATVPGAPSSVTAAAGDGKITISFTAPSSDGGAAITGYTASCATGSTTATGTGVASPITVGGLTNGTAYSCSVTATNRIGNSAASTAASATPVAAVSVAADFPGDIVLGAPTDTSMRMKLYSVDRSGTLTIAYKAATDASETQSAPQNLVAGKVLEVTLNALRSNTAYQYRVILRQTGSTTDTVSKNYRFQTARPKGQSFTFTVQADSHMDENSDVDQYKRTLANVLADQPDFHVDLGDTFMTEKHAEPLTAVIAQPTSKATLDARYRYERANFGLLTHSAPLFLVNGNHDAELGWLVDGSAQSLPMWASQARLEFFPIPTPNAFYTGDSFVDPVAGNRVAWYSWNWGDAQFIVLDPFWNTATKPGADAWNFTLGARQYQWLIDTLSKSTATFKFVFLHNLVGGLDGAMRGGIEAAPFYEWGGKNSDSSAGFAQKRPGWAAPIHDLLVKYKVTAVFKGHDHVYVRQELDGVVYQTVPQPSAKNNNSGANIASDYHYVAGTIVSSSGHLRVTVTPGKVTSQYVRAWLPKDENATRRNSQIDHEWTVNAPAGVSPQKITGPAKVAR